MSNQIKENEIRPETLMKSQRVAMTIDIGRLLKHAADFIHVNCPACDKDSFRLKYNKYGLDIVECESCNTLYTNPRPTDKVLEEFYKNSFNYEYWNNHIFPASEDARRKRIFVPRVDKTIEFCNKYGVNNKSLLEIGAAFGTYCVEMASRNFFNRIVAVEPTPSLAQTLRDKEVNVIEDTIENIHFNEQEKFDVVVNFEVIEHIFSPKKFIENCHKLLKKGGLFIVTCPNGKGFDFETLGDKCNSLDHEHLNYFNPDSLSFLLERCGFEVLEVLTPGRLDAELVRKKILSGELDISGQSFLNHVLIDKWDDLGEKFQNFLAENNLSSNLWIVARAQEGQTDNI
jgi:2-polyprenyl-3-methyl-5-hydroxy-6-metoxy-1,4-benzoquinol methylase